MPNLARLLFRLPDRWLLRMAGGSPRVVAGRTLDPALQLIAHGAGRQPHMAEGTPQAARAASDRGMKLLSGPRRAGVTIDRIRIPGPGGELGAHLHRPSALSGPAPLLLWFHQGGFVIGHPRWDDAFLDMVADTAGCLTLSVDYRLAPEHRFPAQHEDATAAWRWAVEHAQDLGADPRRIAVGGDSAGGNLAAALTQLAKREGGVQPCFQLLVYPWVVGSARTPSVEDFADAYPLDGRLMDFFRELAFEKPEQVEDPRVCPLNEPDFSGLPPALVVNAGFDPICDEGRLYAEKLAAAGVPTRYRCYDSLCHSFLAMGAIPAARRAQQEIADEVRRALQEA